MKRSVRILFWIGLAGVVIGLTYCDYLVWKTVHPNAPAWAFWVAR